MMNENQKQFVKDMMATYANDKLYHTVLLFCAVFGFSGFLFAVISLEDVLTYLGIYTTYQTFFVLSLFCMAAGLGSIHVLLRHYLSMYGKDSAYDRIIDLPLTYACMIPGLIMIVYVAMISTVDLVFPLPHICFYLCIYAIVVIFVSYHITKVKIQSMKKNVQKKMLRFVEEMILGFLLGLFFSVLLIRGSVWEDLMKIALLTLVVTFLAYQCGRSMYAVFSIKGMEMEMIDARLFYHEGTLNDDAAAQRVRVTIAYDHQLETALSVIEEFGFDKEKCMYAIMHHEPFFTFDERMLYDIEFMKKLLARFAYEGISFETEEWHKEWVKTDAYQHIEKRKYVRKKKETEIEKEKQSKKDKEKQSMLSKVLTPVFGIVIVGIFMLWYTIFPYNFFRPVHWASKERCKEIFNEYTYYSGMTVYHFACIWILISVFIFVPSVSSWYCNLLGQTMSTICIVFIVFFIGEMFVFPLYLKRLNKVINTQTHNYEKSAMWMFVLMTFIRMFTRGFVYTTAQLILLIAAVESAKSLFVYMRYIVHAKEKDIAEIETKYEIVEEYDISLLKEFLHRQTHTIIEMHYCAEEPTRFQSKLGGIPYLLKGETIPGGENMYLLVQINLDELEGKVPKGYPKCGMLQFFIEDNLELGGGIEDVFDSTLKVVYHETIDYDPCNQQEIDCTLEMEMPILKSSALHLECKEEYEISSSDSSFHDYLEKAMQAGVLPKDYLENDVLMETIDHECYIDCWKNKMGGLGCFAQEDVRNDDPRTKDMEILLQLVSDEEHMMWSDYGTCHVLINREDLEKLDFSHVAYTWDCY